MDTLNQGQKQREQDEERQRKDRGKLGGKRLRRWSIGVEIRLTFPLHWLTSSPPDPSPRSHLNLCSSSEGVEAEYERLFPSLKVYAEIEA
eukprot:c40094_g1_i1 orf=113-382(+)